MKFKPTKLAMQLVLNTDNMAVYCQQCKKKTGEIYFKRIRWWHVLIENVPYTMGITARNARLICQLVGDKRLYTTTFVFYEPTEHNVDIVSFAMKKMKLKVFKAEDIGTLLNAYNHCWIVGYDIGRKLPIANDKGKY